MNCFVCGSHMKDYIQKTIAPETFERNYVRCEFCGLVLCQTMYEMTSDEWEAVNACHKSYQGREENPPDDLNWLSRLHSQARLLADLAASGVWERETRAVDYGCGDGKLADYVRDELRGYVRNADAWKLLKYDKYMRPEDASDYLGDADMRAGSFDVVVSCSVFEHLIGQSDVNEVIGLLNDQGTLCTHTLVCEEVPQDPDWFYLSGAHCTMWTNKSMGLLYERYGFVGCAYHVESRMWFFFRNRKRFELLRTKSPSIPGEWVFSDKFVDYWKQKPYR